MILVGGMSSTSTVADTVELYHPTTDSISILASMVSPRAFHAATLLADGRLLVSGGFGDEEFIKIAEIYDRTADKWTPAGNMVFGTMLHTSRLLPDGKVLTFGGSREGLELTV
ncbi:MAG: hypothetical protein IH998_17365, partial [Proteobacteria bacterium]|nr:hypothetical protein [Pseudomonadota bacterium]